MADGGWWMVDGGWRTGNSLENCSTMGFRSHWVDVSD